MGWGLWFSSQSCSSSKGLTSMQLNHDKCADEAVDVACLSKKGKTAGQIYVSLFQGRVSTDALVEVHLCKGLWSEELMDTRAQQWQPRGTEASNSPGSDWKPHIKKLTSLPAGFLSDEPSPPRPVYPQALLTGSAGTTSIREQPRAAPKEVSDKVHSDLDGNRSWHKMLQVIAWSHCDSTLSKSIFRLNFILQIESRIQFLCLAEIVFALQDTRSRRNNSNVPHNHLHVF